ncbi:MAG: alpha/beta hydrolase [Microbacteriaceae bacterium]
MKRSTSGVMPGGLNYTRRGDGPPLVFLRTLAPSERNPRLLGALLERWELRGAIRTHTVYAVGRPPHLRPGLTMAALADQYALAIAGTFATPVPVMGFSTSAGIALQLALDDPQLVSKLVIVCGAFRLSGKGRAMQRRYAERLAHRDRTAGVEMVVSAARYAVTRVAVSVATALTPLPKEPLGLMAMLEAEDHFDLGDRLGEVAVPTLVVAGGRDTFYPPSLTRATAAGVQHGQFTLYARRRHHEVLSDPHFEADLRHFLASA